jgi:peptidoglycan/LPS O-acetylase OafA/YrhL
LQVFRGMAALAVVVHHALLSTQAFVGTLPTPLAALLNMGYLGVDFFFVLSGFIIMHAHMDDVRTRAAWKRYALKRLSRIYPAYLPIGLALIGLYALMPGLSAAGGEGGGRDISLLSSVLLLPADGSPALSVAWTLVHELMFYFVFLLFYVSWRWLALGLVGWVLLIVVSSLLYAPTGWVRYPLSMLNIEFVMGVGAAWTVRFRAASLGQGAKGLAFAGLVVSIGTVGLMMQHGAAWFHLLLAFGLTLIVIGFAVAEQSSAARWPALLMLLGNASYSIYLVHSPLLSLSQRFAVRLGLDWPGAMVFGVSCGVVAGLVYYRVVERPSLRFFRRRWS